MAVGTGIGIDLNALNKALKQADDALLKLYDTGEKVSDRLIKTLLNVGSRGIDPFVSKLREQKDVLEMLSQIKMEGLSGGMKKVVRDIQNMLDATNKEIEAVTKLNEAFSPLIQARERSKIQANATYNTDAALHDLKIIDDQIKAAEEAEKTKIREAERTHTARQKEYDEMGRLLNEEDRLRNELFNVQLERIRKENEARQKAIQDARNAEIKAHEDRQREYDEMGRKLQEYANINLSTKASSQQYAAESEQQRRFYEALIREKYEKEYEEFYKTALREREETARINQQISHDKIDQLGRESRERLKVEQMIRDTQRRNYEAREKELNDLFREQERQAKAQAKADSDTRKLKYKAYTTSYAGAIYTSDHANTLAKEIKAVKNLEAAREKLNKTDRDYARKLDELNTRIKQHNKNIERATSGTKALNGALAAVGRGIASAFSVQALRGYVNKMIQVRGEMELQQRSLQAILQNKDAANEIWQKTIDLAVRSPFRIKDLVTYTKQLAAYRIEADKLYETNKMLADVSAGLGVDMQRLILAFGQVKAANFLRGTELRQFTEAGIPMLDELAKHFNDMNNTALTSADVFEMISKRMVLFEDVEAVFERMTRAGGTFYRMQEIQAETLRGQISNLKDSLDIMFNEMGKANDGALKVSVKAVKGLVDNYKTLVPILKALVSSLAVYKLNAFLAARQTGILASALLNLGVATEKFFLTLSKNPWTATAAIILAAAGAVYRYVKALNDVNKAYSDMSKQQSEITSKFFKAKDVDERKRALKDLIDYADKEYSIKVSLDLEGMSDDEVRTEMNNLRQQMIKANAFGAEFQKEWIRTNQRSSTGQWWDAINPLMGQGINKDIDQMGDSYENLNSILVNNLAPTIDYLSTKLATLDKDQRNALESLKAGIGEWSNKDEDIVDYFERIRKNYETLIKELADSDNVADKKIARQLKRYQRRYDEAEKEFQSFIDNIDDNVKKLSTEDKTVFLNAAIDDAKAEKNWSKFEETQIRKWLEKKYTIELTPKIVEEDEELKAWQDSYNKLFEGKKGWRKIRTKGTSQTQVIEQLNAQYKATEEIVKRIQQAGEDSILEGGAYEGENLEKLKKDLADIREQLDWFGAEDKEDKKKESASIKILQKRISLLKEVNKKYLELEKTFDAVTAKEKVMEAYSDTFREAFEGTGVDLSLYKVMTQTIIDAKKVGEDAGIAMSEGMLEKIKALEESGTYVRSFSEDLVEQIKKAEGFRAKAYQDAGGVWTQGYGETQGVEKHREWTQEEAEQRLRIRLTKDYASAVNKVLDANKDLIVTQEQYNSLVDLAYQGGGGAVKRLVSMSKDVENGVRHIESIQQKVKDTMGEDAAKRFGESFVQSFRDAETIQERMALLLQTMNLTIKGKINTAWYEGMQKRSDERSSMFRGDLDIAKQLESVLVRISGMDFATTEGMVEALSKLKEIAEKEGQEAKNILSQAISGLEAEIGLRVKKDADKQLNKEIEDLFDQYELTLDLKKLNLPKQAAEKLFDTKYLDLEALRKAVEDRASEFVGTEQAEQYKKFLEKIDELERKDLVERTKKYLEYAKSTISERAKIKMEELTKLKEIEDTFRVKQGDSEDEVAYKKDMRLRAGLKAREEAQKALQSLEWDEFQKTDTFTSLFDDMDNASDALVTHMIEKLRDFKDEWKDMPLEDMKSIVNKINELEVALAERSPWEAYRKAKRAVKEARKDAKYSFESEEARNLYGKGKSDKDYIAALQIENAYQEQKVESAKEEMAIIEEMIGLKEGTLPYEVNVLNYSKQQMQYAAMTKQQLHDLLKDKKKEVDIANTIILDNGQIIVQYKNQEKSLKKQAETLGEMQKMANDLYDAFVDLSKALGADDDSPVAIFADMGVNMMNAVLNTIMLQAQLKAVEVGAYAAGTAINSAMGIIGWIVMAIQLVAAGIKAIAKINDNKIIAQLEEQANLIERQRDIYEQIEERVEKAYSVGQLEAYNKELEKSVDLEIQALEASIALEKSRKKSDEEQIATWEKEILDARKRVAESTQEMKEEMGGIFDLTDFASGFVDAWWDAMEEGKSGLDALSEHFDETMTDMVKKQALYKGASKIMEQLQKAINEGLEEDYSIGQDEWDAIVDAANKANIDLDKFLEGYRALFGQLSLGGEGGLSGLTKGIQGITEDTAQIIEAYLNSIRAYTSEQVEYTKKIYNMFYAMTMGSANGLNVRLIS